MRMSSVALRALLLLSLTSGLTTGVVRAAGPESRLVFPNSGFSITALDAPSKGATYQALVMTLPASEGFSPNVNVQLQAFAGGIDAYMELSEKQMEAMGWTIISRRKDATSVTYEFKGLYQNRPLHWYSRAEASQGTVYLVTATAAESQWERVQATLRASVDSFRREGSK